MPDAFEKPRFDFRYRVNSEIKSLREYRDTKPGRAIPAKTRNRFLIATWNIANLGTQKRRRKDHQLLAEVVSWFDLVGVQETKTPLNGVNAILKELPNSWRAVFTDPAGNRERMTILYDSARLTLLEQIGEIAVPDKDKRFIRLPGISRKFNGFDRNPFIASFKIESFRFIVANAHLYFGRNRKQDKERRSLEAYAIARWADLRSNDESSYSQNIIALGDFNIPKVEPGDAIFRALTKRGLQRPPHSTRIYSNIANDKEYDQIMVVPTLLEDRLVRDISVFDFDSAIFSGLWQSRSPQDFRSYLRYYISDHRPLWAAFKYLSSLLIY